MLPLWSDGGKASFWDTPSFKNSRFSIDVINYLHFKEEKEEQYLGLCGLSTDATLAQQRVLCQECGAKHTAAVSLQRE